MSFPCITHLASYKSPQNIKKLWVSFFVMFVSGFFNDSFSAASTSMFLFLSKTYLQNTLVSQIIFIPIFYKRGIKSKRV